MIMKDMFKRFDLRFIAAGIASLLLGINTITGTVQEVIPFNDPVNEMFFAFTSILLGILCLIISTKEENKVASK